MRGTRGIRNTIIIVLILLTFAACAPIITEERVTVLEQRIEEQQEIIISITTHFSQLSNDYVLLERRVEALEAP